MMRVLLCDDSSFMRSIIKTSLKELNFIEVVGEASNGNECVELYSSLNPDVVVLDITMPEMDGIATLTKLRSLNKDAYVIMCSAMGQSYYVSEAIMAGAKDFIVKPFSKDLIVEVMEKARMSLNERRY